MKDQELHKAAEKATDIDGLDWENVYAREKFIEGAQWQQERMYSEEDIKFAYEQGARLALISQSSLALHKGKFPTPDEWFKQFKK